MPHCPVADSFLGVNIIHINKNMTLIKKIGYFIISLGLLMPVFCLAQLNNPIDSEDLDDFIGKVANMVAIVGGVVAVIFIIWSGFLFVSARGNEEKLKTAKKALTWTIIGTAVLLGAYAISQAVIEIITNLG